MGDVKRREKCDFDALRLFCLFLLALVTVLTVGNFGLSVTAAGEEEEESIVDPIKHKDSYSAFLYNNTNGLPTPEANDIVQTSEGVLWIASYGGLVRYDGENFERMDSTEGIASVVCLFVDKKDRLWVGTNDSGVAVLEKGKFRKWNKLDGLVSSSVRDIIEDSNGLIYIATSTGMSIITENGTIRPIDDSRIKNAYMRELRIGAEGLVYGLTDHGDIFTIRDGRIETFLDGNRNRVRDVICMFPDPLHPGSMYLGTSNTKIYHGSLHKQFDDVTERDISPLAYTQSFEYIDGKIWICAGNGIGLLEDDHVEILDNIPMKSSINHMIVDYEGNLWFSSSRQGVMKIVKNAFFDLYTRYNLPAAVVNTTCMYRDRLFIGTDTGLTVLGKESRISSLPLAKAATASGKALDAKDLLGLLDGCRIRSIIRDSRNRLWISTWQKLGLLCLDQDELTVYSVEDGLLSNHVRAVYERSDGSILVVNTGGVSVISNGRVTKSYSADEGIVNTESLTVVEGYHGEIILGSDGDGIYVINDQVTRHISSENGLTSDVVMRIKRDLKREVFWIITSNSIAYMDADYNVTTVRKFPYSNNFDVYQNSKDETWVLSSNGIYVLPTDELLKNEEIAPVHYGIKNGLPCISTANSYSDLTADGNLYLAGRTGVAEVNIESPFENVSNLKVSIPYIDADGVRIYPDNSGRYTVPSNVKKLTLYSYVYNYSLITPDVTYQLEGFEDKGNTVSRNELAPVSYTNLSGGEYRFVMSLSDSRGFFNKTVAVDIVKEKAFYEEPWFYIIIILSAVLIFVGIIRFFLFRKMNRLEKKNRENLTFIREITEAFAKVIDMKDNYTNGHSMRVAKYTAMLSREMGLDEETIEKYYYVALLHDIGKVGVPTEVLNKPGKLTDEEYETIKSHVTQGYEALKGINIMPELSQGAQFHHERPDGKGYPNHLKEGEIPRVAQIIAVADCFDAMYSNRPYRKRMKFDKVISIIKEVSGTQLAPDVVEAFLRLVEKGEFRAPDDDGGGTTENIDNIHKSYSSDA